jgi:glycosyltransferase involved in cell wall biosynthesis
MPLFSIITINLNNAIGLQKTIDSVLSQSYDDYEYIIIDGASTDDSIEHIMNCRTHLAYWVSERDTGIYDAMNKAIAAAKGDYCLFLNSGDILYSKTVLQDVADQNPNADIVYGDMMNSRNGKSEGLTKNPDKLSWFFLLVNVITHPAQFIKRELFNRFGGYSQKYLIASDYEFFLRVYFKSKIRTYHLPLIISEFDRAGVSNNPAYAKKNLKEKIEVQKLYFPKWLITLYYCYLDVLHSVFFRKTGIAYILRRLNKLILTIFKIPA